MILNIIILNHKESGAKLSGCTKKIAEARHSYWREWGMVLPDVAKAVKGRGILNTIILNHKENGAELSGCGNKPPSASPERVTPARRSVPAFRAAHKSP